MGLCWTGKAADDYLNGFPDPVFFVKVAGFIDLNCYIQAGWKFARYSYFKFICTAFLSKPFLILIHAFTPEISHQRPNHAAKSTITVHGTYLS